MVRQQPQLQLLAEDEQQWPASNALSLAEAAARSIEPKGNAKRADSHFSALAERLRLQLCESLSYADYSGPVRLPVNWAVPTKDVDFAHHNCYRRSPDEGRKQVSLSGPVELVGEFKSLGEKSLRKNLPNRMSDFVAWGHIARRLAGDPHVFAVLTIEAVSGEPTHPRPRAGLRVMGDEFARWQDISDIQTAATGLSDLLATGTIDTAILLAVGSSGDLLEVPSHLSWEHGIDRLRTALKPSVA